MEYEVRVSISRIDCSSLDEVAWRIAKKFCIDSRVDGNRHITLRFHDPVDADPDYWYSMIQTLFSEPVRFSVYLPQEVSKIGECDLKR